MTHRQCNPQTVWAYRLGVKLQIDQVLLAM